MRLGFDPHEDPLARQKVQITNDAIIRHIEQGKALYDIEDLVRDLESELDPLTLEGLENKAAELKV